MFQRAAPSTAGVTAGTSTTTHRDALPQSADAAFPLARFGYDRVMPAGARQFCARAARADGRDGAGPAAA